MNTKPLKPKRCKAPGCRSLFVPRSSWAKACSPECSEVIATQVREKKARQEALADRRETRGKLEQMKTRGEWLAEAKTAVQKFRRLEELAAGYGCISCGRTQQEVEGTDAWKPGGAWDGGHMLSKGARPELALEPLNIWLQCKSCNAGSSKYARKGYTVNQNFRAAVVERIGLAAVEAMEADHTPRHYSIDDLRGIKTKYAALARQLRKERE